MTDELVFYTNPMSRGRIARWMLEEVGAPYRSVVLDYAADAMRTADYLAINPMGKVPAIVHAGRVVTETPAICAYLADAFPDAALAPPPEDRADYYRWLFFASGPFEQAVTAKVLRADVSSQMERMVGFGRLDTVLGALETFLSDRDHVAGGRFSAADVYLASQLGWQMGFGTIERRPAFVTYTERMFTRPAFARVAEIDGAMPG